MPPSGDDPPLLGDYFLAMITMVCLSVVTTVFVIRVSAKSGSVPTWVQWLFLRLLARLTCMHREDIAYSPPVEQLRSSSTLESALKLMAPESNKTQNSCLVSDSVADDLRFIRRDLEEKNHEELRLSQWKHVARVIDRCLLLTFLVYAIVTSAVLIWRATGLS
ncbi:neuronal acetylcholine receptor subunit beta-3-like [Amphiura filiformis]|uniref:neuronal acetylcholine receptor subunit beta-3-like n=1 Tax=Amphiura filiformis TaxID=82378 RepID=UPI003B210EAD